MDVDQLYHLTNALNLPNIHITESQNIVHVLKGVVLVCTCYSHSGNMYKLVECFDRCQLEILEIVNKFTKLIDNQWSHILSQFQPGASFPRNLAMYAVTITSAGSPMTTIWGFLDCTIQQICCPLWAQ
jgi:energy-converting hydrogenase Eha subunit G